METKVFSFNIRNVEIQRPEDEIYKNSPYQYDSTSSQDYSVYIFGKYHLLKDQINIKIPKIKIKKRDTLLGIEKNK